MKPLPIIRRRQAREDIDAIVQHYMGEAGSRVALHFVVALEQAMQHVSGFPDSGSPRYARLMAHSGLRSWPVKAFPYLIFYIAGSTQIDVWRVLHGERDIPSCLHDKD